MIAVRQTCNEAAVKLERSQSAARSSLVLEAGGSGQEVEGGDPLAPTVYILSANRPILD